MIRAVIVDDEAPPRERIRSLLAPRNDITVIGEASDGSGAVKQLAELAPDLVFLDVRMPGLDGFEVLEALGDQAPPAVVFVTAFDDYAVRAFDAHAADYLLKPIHADRFARAVDRAVARLAAHPDRDGRMPRLVQEWVSRQRPRRFAVRVGDRVKLVPDEAILWIEGAGNYARLHTATDRLPVRVSLRDLEATLDPTRFVRVHRSTIVAMAAIRSIVPEGDGEYSLVLEGGATLRSSRRHGARVRELLRAGTPRPPR